MKDTHLYLFKKINKFFSLKCDIYYAFTFKPSKNLFKMQVAYICLNKIKGKSFYILLPPLNMNKMKIFNLVHKIKNPKTDKSCAVDRLKMPYI